MTSYSSSRLELKIKEELKKPDRNEVDTIWFEFVSDLWTKHLPHLREVMHGGREFLHLSSNDDDSGDESVVIDSSSNFTM